MEINNNLISKKLTDCSSGTLLIPSINSHNINVVNSLILDNTNNCLSIYNIIDGNTERNNIILQDRCAFIRLNNEISGNDLSYNQIENKWFIDNSKNLILSEFHNNSNIYEYKANLIIIRFLRICKFEVFIFLQFLSEARSKLLVDHLYHLCD